MSRLHEEIPNCRFFFPKAGMKSYDGHDEQTQKRMKEDRVRMAWMDKLVKRMWADIAAEGRP